MNIKVERLMGLNLIKNRCLIRRERAFPWFKMINYTKAPGKGCSTFITSMYVKLKITIDVSSS